MSGGGSVFKVTGDCSRCAMVDLDPDTGLPSKSGALRALASYRRKHSNILFGKYLALNKANSNDSQPIVANIDKQDRNEFTTNISNEQVACLDNVIADEQGQVDGAKFRYECVRIGETTHSVCWLKQGEIVKPMTT